MESLLVKLFLHHNQPIVLRRGETTISSQPFRVEPTGAFGSFVNASAGVQISRTDIAQASKSLVVLLGLRGSNIETGDRFTIEESAFVVTMVKPMSLTASNICMAFAELRQ